MNVDQRRRAGQAVAARIQEIAATPTTVARAAGISTNTLRSLINGTRWPTAAVRGQIEAALYWPAGEIAAIAVGRQDGLAAYSDFELAAELARRLARQQRDAEL